jgi:hypothetical protein
MFFRQKRSGVHVYLQIVENRWEKGRSKQRVIAAVGRLDQLRQSGQLDRLLHSGAKFAEAVMVLAAHRQGDVPSISTSCIGPALVFGRLCEELQIPQVIERLLAGRHFSLATPFAPRCTKDAFEEALFDRRRDLFSHLDLVFFDTTSICFEGEGGVELGQYGHSKDHRPDCKQMVVGVVLDGEGRPLCCELWPGNVTDVKTLIPIVDRRMVEETFRTVKTLLETRPIFHKCDETIRGHVFCSFLALLLRKELQDRLEAQGDKFEWAQLLGNLEALQHTAVESQGKRFLLRSDLANTTAAVFRAVGVAIPPSVQKTEE